MCEDHLASDFWMYGGKKHASTAWVWRDEHQLGIMMRKIDGSQLQRKSGCQCLSYQELHNDVFQHRARLPAPDEFQGWSVLHDWKNGETDRIRVR